MESNKIKVIIWNVVLLLIVLIVAGLWGIKKPEITPPTPKPAETVATTNQEFSLSIPSLEISTPVIINVDGNDKEAYFKALEGGVAHYAGTALPGTGGNIFIFGHSSYYAWAPGSYKEIFKTLEDINEGDEIDVQYNGKKYTYVVESTKVVDPTDVSVLSPTTTEQLTLMTCVPPGTAEQRLIVVAKPK